MQHNYWWNAWRGQKKSQTLQAILSGTLPLSGVLVMAAQGIIERHFGIPYLYSALYSFGVFLLWVPLFIALYRSIVHETDQEKRVMEQRHAAEDAALFGKRNGN